MEFNLRGDWKLFLDLKDCGEQDKWFIPGNFPIDFIHYFFPVDNTERPFCNSKSAWIKKEFQIKKINSKYAYLVFFGTDKGKIWLNGKYIGEMKRISGKQSYDITNYIEEHNYLVLKFEDIKEETLGLWKNAYIMEETSVPSIAKKFTHPIPKWANKAMIYTIAVKKLITPDKMDDQIKNLLYLRGLGINTICLFSDYSGFIPNKLIDYAHKIGFKIIINFDNIPFPYNQIQTMDFITHCMKFWIQKYDADGFQFNTATKFPLSFWNNTIAEIKSIKNDILMLAKEDNPDLYIAGFDLTYDSHLSGILDKINKKYYDIEEFSNYIYTQYQYYPQNSKRIIYLESLPSSKESSIPSNNVSIPYNIMKLFTPGIPVIDNCDINDNMISSSVQQNFNNNNFNKYYKDLLILKKNSLPLNDQSADSFFFSKGLSYFEIIRTSMNKNIHAVFDTHQSSVTIIKNGKKHIMFQNYKYA